MVARMLWLAQITSLKSIETITVSAHMAIEWQYYNNIPKRPYRGTSEWEPGIKRAHINSSPLMFIKIFQLTALLYTECHRNERENDKPKATCQYFVGTITTGHKSLGHRFMNASISLREKWNESKEIKSSNSCTVIWVCFRYLVKKRYI